jgi:hypothetical protein
MFVCCDCSVLSGRGLCDELIIRPEKPYRPWPVFVCDHETSRTMTSRPAVGPPSHANNNNNNNNNL